MPGQEVPGVRLHIPNLLPTELADANNFIGGRALCHKLRRGVLTVSKDRHTGLNPENSNPNHQISHGDFC